MEPQNQEQIFPLDDDLIELVRQGDAEALAIQQRVNGMLMYFMRKHSLSGAYRLSLNRRELVRDAQAMQPETP